MPQYSKMIVFTSNCFGYWKEKILRSFFIPLHDIILANIIYIYVLLNGEIIDVGSIFRPEDDGDFRFSWLTWM